MDTIRLADDLLEGAAQIALFVFGSDSAKSRRRMYHLASSDSPIVSQCSVWELNFCPQIYTATLHRRA